MGLLIPDSSLPDSWRCPDRPRANYLPLFVKNLQELRNSRLNQRMLTFVLVPVAFVVVAFMVSYRLNTFVA